MQPKCVVFLDTSALLSGLNSTLGASALIIALFKLHHIQLIISPDVIEEANEAIVEKFPLLESGMRDFLLSKPSLVKPSLPQVQAAYATIGSSDAPILAGAIFAKAPFLVTLDKKFIQLVSKKIPHCATRLLLPSEFAQWYRKEFQLN